jgi:hypothetical protein
MTRPMRIAGRGRSPLLNLFSLKVREVKQNPFHYTFIPGAGHILVGPIAAENGKPLFGSYPNGMCDAPPGAADESWHLLLPPNGSKPKAFQWLAAPRQWFRLDSTGRALRSGWTPAYLSSWGWRYAGRGSNLHG